MKAEGWKRKSQSRASAEEFDVTLKNGKRESRGFRAITQKTQTS
jgi:hypothetical protein